MFIHCTLKRSPEPSHTQGLVDASAAIMRKPGVEVETIRLLDHDIATGVYPDMREHGWGSDEWPEIYPRLLDADILVAAGPIWLGDNSSQMKVLIERIYSLSSWLDDKGQHLFYGRVAGCLITGNEDGIKHCAQNVLYSLQHVGSRSRPTATPAGSSRPAPARRTSTPAAVAPRALGVERRHPFRLGQPRVPMSQQAAPRRVRRPAGGTRP